MSQVSIPNASEDTSLRPTEIQLHISIDGIKPLIWRRVVVPINWTLEDLHLVIQAAFNWKNCHGYEFQMGGLRFGDKAMLEEYSSPDSSQVFKHREVRLKDFVGPGVSFTYVYDFGDDWRHTVKIEKYLTTAPPLKTADCLVGARATPPEDVGGEPGYENFMAIMANPKSPEHAFNKRWCGGAFDPEWFDLAVVKADVAKALKPNVKRALYQPKVKIVP